MEREIVIPLEDFKEMAADQAKLQMLIDALLNNSDWSEAMELLTIAPKRYDAIMRVIDPKGYSGAVEWLKEKKARAEG